MKHLFAAATLFLLFTFTALSQGLYWESIGKISVMGNDREIDSRFYAMPKMFKSMDGKDHESIVRLDKGIIINVNNNDSTYSEMTFEELQSTFKKGNAKLDESMAELKEKLKEMPEEQRKMVEQMMAKNPMMGGEQGGAYTVKNTGEAETISGYKCSKYVVSQGENEVLTVWATKDIKGVDALKTDMQEFRAKMAVTMPRIGGAMAEGMKDVDGFPIRIESKYYNSTVTKVEKKSTPAKAFEPPSSYTKTKPPSMDDKEEGKE